MNALEQFNEMVRQEAKDRRDARRWRSGLILAVAATVIGLAVLLFTETQCAPENAYGRDAAKVGADEHTPHRSVSVPANKSSHVRPLPGCGIESASLGKQGSHVNKPIRRSSGRAECPPARQTTASADKPRAAADVRRESLLRGKFTIDARMKKDVIIARKIPLGGLGGSSTSAALKPNRRISGPKGRSHSTCRQTLPASAGKLCTANRRATRGASRVSPAGSILDYVHYRESRCGKDPKCRRGIIGPAGEEGEYQITPIFVKDVKRISGLTIDPYCNDSCRGGITVWLSHYAPVVGAVSIEERYELYRRGPGGYRRWKRKEH